MIDVGVSIKVSRLSLELEEGKSVEEGEINLASCRFLEEKKQPGGRERGKL